MKTIKGKINFGVIFLFSVILILSILGIFFINQLVLRSKGTIVENYLSVDYMIIMLNALDDINVFQVKNIRNRNTTDSSLVNEYLISKKIFEKNLQLEIENITETGEDELANELSSNYKEYMNYYENLSHMNEGSKSILKNETDDLEMLHDYYLKLRSNIIDIYKINMDAIRKKNNELQATADEVILYMSIVAVISILVTLSFIFSFPSKIIKPIKELTERIKSISDRKYDQKLEINSNDELGELANAFNTMAQRLKLYEAKHIDQLLFEQKRMESLVNGLEDGVLLIDENRKVVLANNTILQITGLKEKDILSHYVPDIAAYNDLIREIYKAAVNLKSENNNTIKPIRIVQDNKESFYKIETEDIITYSEFSKQETFIGNLILLRNITQYHELDKAKTNLLATASHELKTPLSSINLTLKLIEDTRLGELNAEQKGLIQDIRRQTNRLSRVINEILDYSQIETGNIRLKFSKVKPDDIVDYAATSLMIVLSEKKILLETEIEENLLPITADIEKTVWVLMNLLSNAIRYSKEGGKIILSAKSNGDSVKFSVEDFGPGIPNEDLEKLFKRFSQVGQRSKQGWGLGLAISKEFVQAQDGKIWVESQLGKGSIFSFSLPFSKS